MTKGWKLDDYIIAIGMATVVPTQLVLLIIAVLQFQFGYRIM